MVIGMMGAKHGDGIDCGGLWRREWYTIVGTSITFDVTTTWSQNQGVGGSWLWTT